MAHSSGDRRTRDRDHRRQHAVSSRQPLCAGGPGNHPLKGFTPGGRSRLAGARRGLTDSRFEALRGTRLTPLVGRTQELTFCSTAGSKPRKVRPGRSPTASPVSEIAPGPGSARALDRDPHTFLGCYCSPHRVDLRCSRSRSSRALGQFRPRDDSGISSPSSTAARAAGMRTSPARALFASLLSIQAKDATPRRDEPAAAARADLGCARRSGRRARGASPVLLVWEDVPGLIRTSLEAVWSFDRSLAGLAVLALVTFRPEFARRGAAIPMSPGLSSTA